MMVTSHSKKLDSSTSPAEKKSTGCFVKSAIRELSASGWQDLASHQGALVRWTSSEMLDGTQVHTVKDRGEHIHPGCLSIGSARLWPSLPAHVTGTTPFS